MEYQLQPAEHFQSLNGGSGQTSNDELRNRVKKCTKDFKMSWRNLAQSLKVVWKDKSYKKWGYENFDDYTHQEVHIRKATAMKLIQSYSFLELEAPQYCIKKEDPSIFVSDESSAEVPSFEAVSALRRAKTKLEEGQYQSVKRDIFENNKDVSEVKKDLTAMIRSRVCPDPQKEHAIQRERIIKRFAFTLKTLSRDIKNLNLLPEEIVSDINSLLEKIERVADIDVKIE